MILDAADIAGLSVLQLVHENTAAATMFGVDRLDREKPVTILFYNMGNMDTEVSIARYSTITEMPANKTYEHVEILAEAWDPELGGADLDKILLDMLAERFNSLKERQGKPDVRENPKVIKRLQKEVLKLKDILSANKQVQVKLGELADYVSLSTVIERKEFEDRSQSFFDRVLKPIDVALEKAGLTMDQIDQIELLGGGIRVPRIQELLLQKQGSEHPLGVHLNGDEAMCFGSAFIASNSSASFKVRKVFLTQHPEVPFTIRISPANASRVIQNEDERDDTISDAVSDEESNNTSQGITYEKTFELYKKIDFLGQKKSLSITYDTNMKIEVFTTGEKEEQLATYTVNGIDEIADSEL
jgi:hypoxia up-regulated 1